MIRPCPGSNRLPAGYKTDCGGFGDACQDFGMPFKYSNRAALIDETAAGFSRVTSVTTTARSSARPQLTIRSRRFVSWISPGIPIVVTPDDRRAGRDPVLKKPLEMAPLALARPACRAGDE
jgi:hypothetical protein